MNRKHVVVILFTILSIQLHAQNMTDYTDSWEGKIDHAHAFNFAVTITGLNTDTAVFQISNTETIIHQLFKLKPENRIAVTINPGLSFEGALAKNDREINGFIKSGMLLYHVKLSDSGSGIFTGNWNVLMVDSLKSQNFYLSVENGSGDAYEAYPIFGDDRFTGTWCANFEKTKDSISFTDFKTGMEFKGRLLPQKIELGIYLNNHLFTAINLTPSQNDWVIGALTENKFEAADLHPALKEMESMIAADSLPNTHSVLISRKGRLIYEQYFDGYTANIPHDMRSASKSISSAVVGIAKQNNLFENVDQSIFEFLPEEYQVFKDSLKEKIDLRSLLTMSSGLDAVDFGVDRKSAAAEHIYQPTPNWTETILKAPMLYEPNTHANYGSANPYLLGVAMNSVVEGSLEMFMDEYLFQKLDISNYIIQTDMTGKPYFGGGMYLSPPDMLKFGQLYLQKGKWKDEEILSETWVAESFENYRVLENTADKNEYGYLWWQHTYTVNGKTFKSIEARGAGGQYIFLFPEMETVVVITSGNYRSAKTQQPEWILEKYVLPALMNPEGD